MKKISVGVCALLVVTICLINANKDQSALNDWNGSYRYTEILPAGSSDNPNERYGIIDYNITIYSEDNCYIANIENEGYQTKTNVQAKVIEDENRIDLLFDKYLSGHIWGKYSENELLLSLIREENELYTIWEAIQTNTSLMNNLKIGVYFEKVE
ncbi:MAG: DUF5991 domain-containing protein [Lachnospiraceae bacterium]|nr:DUF5991 domain-containing protein [Lachnospiraceae bacterium]